ncbi:MAG: cysteine synthase family protein [Tenericutes bacterium]|jgi:cysteine synthase A|nr:cysteine synthase family protein [Mycoplasmatota bacterium]
MSLYDNILETIGNTPLVRLHKFEKKYNLKNRIYLKLESFNPTNNVKTRPAYGMIKALYESGEMTNKTTIIEASSGNTGIGLAMVGAYYGNETIIVMPEKVSKERVDLIKHYGGKVILTPAKEGIKGSKDKAIQLLNEMNAIIPSQFENPENPKTHYETTAKELAKDLDIIDYIFAGVGTGGTISGVGRYFKKHHLITKMIAVEPKNSQVLKGKKPNPHKIAGISPGYIPDNYDPDVIYDIEAVGDEESWKMTKEFVKLEAISIGISTGAALQAMLNYIKKHKLEKMNIVCISPDSGEKYFSTGVFEEK